MAEPLSLIDQAKQRDEHAFLELLRRYAYIIVSVIRHYLHQIVGYDEDDLHQEIRLRAYHIMPDFRGDDVAFQCWLRRSTRGLCLNILEKQRQHEMIDMETLCQASLEHALPTTSLAPDAEYQRQQTLASVEEAIAALPEHFRNVVVLKDINGLRYEEIAAALKIEVGTVKSRLGRARTILREQLRGVRES